MESIPLPAQVPSPSSRNGHSPAAFVEPKIPALRESITQSSLTTIGVVQKYINFGKGWRPRLFVVEKGVLSYYKIYGPTAVNVQEIINSFRKRSEVKLLGARTIVERDRGASVVPSSAPPHGELHLQVSNTRASQEDNKKFYVYSGAKVLNCKAETSEDRSAWLQALDGPQSIWAIRNDAADLAATASVDSSAVQLGTGMQQLMKNLSAAAVPPALVSEVHKLFLQQQRVYQEFARDEAGKRRELLNYIAELEVAKSTLEHEMITIANGGSIEEFRRGSTDGEHEGLDQHSDEEVDDDVANKDEFLDCYSDDESGEGKASLRSFNSAGSYLTATGSLPAESLSPKHSAYFSETVASLSTPSALPEVIADGASSSGAASLADKLPTLTLLDTATGIDSPTGQGAAAQLGNGSSSSGVALPEPDWLASVGPQQWRERMPVPQQVEEAVSLWQLIKGLVGKDLTRICLPVYFNEPLSALQKCCEDVEYCELLNAATRLPAHSLERLYLVAAFAVSGYSGTLGRTCKPFNPLLGETFEHIHKEKRYRFLAEKVVHHPMILACAAEGVGWNIAADVEMKSSFWGRKMEIFPDGIVELTFHDGEMYRWNKVTTSVNNIIVGKVNVTHGGTMRVRSVTSPNNLQAKLLFHEPSFFSSQNKHAVTGVVEQDGARVPGVVLMGAWDEKFGVEVDGVERCLWVREPQPAHPTRYNLTKFVMGLNEVTEAIKGKIAPTDSRLRPDQLALENGIYDVAFHEKKRLEDRQRAVRKEAEAQGIQLKPRWFKEVPNAKQGVDVQFRYSGGYWETRAKGGPYTGCRDIYGH